MGEALRLNLIIGLAVALLVLIAALLHRTVGLGPYLDGTTVTVPVMQAGVVRGSSFGHPRGWRHQAVRLVQVDHQGKALSVPVRPDAEIGPQMTVRLGTPGARVPAIMASSRPRRPGSSRVVEASGVSSSHTCLG